MTLYRQLIVLTLLLFLVLLTGTWFVTFENNRAFLINQLSSHAQDTATSLALAVSQHVAQQDAVSTESMINAVFDRGYYQTIQWLDLKGQVIKGRHLDVVIEGVPRWFIRLVPIEVPEANAYIMAGWRQIGTIHVKSHPGYAYEALWTDSLRIAGLFAACGLVVLLLGAWGLRVLLKPLNLVREQADAICRKEYAYQENLPRTKELRQVVIAMNRMVEKVKTTFEKQVAVTEEFRKHAYTDPLTGLGNRRYFEAQLRSCLERQEGDAKGILMLVQINDLAQLNAKMGFSAGDSLLAKTADILQETVSPYPNHVLTRLTGGDFGIFLPDAPAWDADMIAADITGKLSLLAPHHIPDISNISHTGAVTFDFSASPKRLLAEADQALRTAQQFGTHNWHVIALTVETEKKPAGQQQWKETIENALKARRIELALQPVVNAADRKSVLHLEVFSKIVDEEGRTFSADLFLPYAERMGLVTQLDRAVVEEVLKLDGRSLPTDQVAVNISLASLCDRSFSDWIRNALGDRSPHAPHVTFEFSEFAAIHNLSLIREFQSSIREVGHGVSLDHFGQNLSSFNQLRSLQPRYVKIDRAFTGDLADAANDTRFYITLLSNVAHSIDMTVIAEGVETEAQYLALKDLHIDAVQGFLIEPPRPISFYLKNS